MNDRVSTILRRNQASLGGSVAYVSGRWPIFQEIARSVPRYSSRYISYRFIFSIRRTTRKIFLCPRTRVQRKKKERERERERERDYCKIWCTEKRREGKRERENSLNWCFRRICANIWNYCHKRSDSPRSFFEGSRGEFRGEWLPTWLRASGLWIIARPRHLDGLVRRRDGKNGGKEDGRLRFEMRGLLGISLFGYAKCSHNVCAARTSACSRDEESTVYVGITRYVEY